MAKKSKKDVIVQIKTPNKTIRQILQEKLLEKQKRQEQRAVWTTQNEIEFIKNIGRHSNILRVKEINRKTLLHRMKQAYLKRDIWDKLEKEKIFQTIDDQILLER